MQNELAQIAQFVQEKFGKALPESIDSLEKLLELVEKNLEIQEEKNKEIFRQFGFREKREKKTGYFDNLPADKITSVLKKINPETNINGEVLRNIAQKYNLSLDVFLVMIKKDGLLLDRDINRNKKLLEEYAKILSTIIGNVNNIQEIAERLNKDNKHLPKMLNKIYENLISLTYGQNTRNS